MKKSVVPKIFTDYLSLQYFLDDNGIELQLERYAIGNEIVRVFIRMHESIR